MSITRSSHWFSISIKKIIDDNNEPFVSQQSCYNDIIPSDNLFKTFTIVCYWWSNTLYHKKQFLYQLSYLNRQCSTWHCSFCWWKWKKSSPNVHQLIRTNELIEQSQTHIKGHPILLRVTSLQNTNNVEEP